MTDLKATVAQRLKQCRSEMSWTHEETAKRLSALSGEKVIGSRYSNWELGLRMPPPEMLIQLGELFGRPPAWLQGFTSNDSTSAVSNKYITANTPNIATKSGVLSLKQTSDISALNVDFIESKGLNRNKLLSITQLDSSMSPAIAQGDEVWIDLDSRDVRKKDLYAFVVGGDAVWIRWVIPQMNSTYLLQAEDRDTYPDQTLNADEFKLLDIIGRVCRVAHDFC